MSHFNSSEEFERTLEVARTGDLLAFERIMHAFEKQVFNHVIRMVGNSQDAEDITQEIFIKLFKNIAQAEAAKGFKAWLFRITTNTVYDFLRKKRRVNEKEFAIIDDEAHLFEPPDPRETYIKIEQGLDIEAALGKIRPVYRAILLLFYKEELSCEEIGRLHNASENTIKTQLRRARAALKEALEQ